jgi:hypothetical protein
VAVCVDHSRRNDMACNVDNLGVVRRQTRRDGRDQSVLDKHIGVGMCADPRVHRYDRAASQQNALRTHD